MPATVPEKPITRQEIKRLLRNKAGQSGSSSTTALDKLQDIESQRLIGRGLPESGKPHEIRVNEGVQFTSEDSVGLAPTGVIAGTYGGATDALTLTINNKGQVTAAVEVPITAGISGLLVTGETPGPIFITNGSGEPIYV